MAGRSADRRLLVRALRSVGIGPSQSTFRPGQVWRYATRPGEEQSRLIVLRVDLEPNLGEIIHIAITGVRLTPSNDDLAPMTAIGHVAVARAALEASRLSLEPENPEVPEFQNDTWRAAFDAGSAGVFSVPVAEIVEAMEATIRDPKSLHEPHHRSAGWRRAVCCSGRRSLRESRRCT